MKNETKAIEAGAIIKMVSGHGSPEYGVLVEKKESKWGVSYKILTEDGDEEWASIIEEETEGPGNPIGYYVVR